MNIDEIVLIFEMVIRGIGLLCCIYGFCNIGKSKDKLMEASTDKQRQDARELKKIAWVIILVGAGLLVGGGYIMDFVTVGIFDF